MTFIIKSLFLALVFIITGGALFRDNIAAKHWILAGLAYIVLITSGMFFVKEFYEQISFTITNINNLAVLDWIKILSVILFCAIAVVATFARKDEQVAVPGDIESNLHSPGAKTIQNNHIESRSSVSAIATRVYKETRHQLESRKSRRSDQSPANEFSFFLIFLLIIELIFIFSWISRSKWDINAEMQFPMVAELACSSVKNLAMLQVKLYGSSRIDNFDKIASLIESAIRFKPRTCPVFSAIGEIDYVHPCDSGDIYVRIGHPYYNTFLVSLKTDRNSNYTEPRIGGRLLGVAGDFDVCRLNRFGDNARARRLHTVLFYE